MDYTYVNFYKGNTEYIAGVPVKDGNFLVDEETKRILIDKKKADGSGDERIAMSSNMVLTTMSKPNVDDPNIPLNTWCYYQTNADIDFTRYDIPIYDMMLSDDMAEGKYIFTITRQNVEVKIYATLPVDVDNTHKLHLVGNNSYSIKVMNPIDGGWEEDDAIVITTTTTEPEDVADYVDFDGTYVNMLDGYRTAWLYQSAIYNEQDIESGQFYAFPKGNMYWVGTASANIPMATDTTSDYFFLFDFLTREARVFRENKTTKIVSLANLGKFDMAFVKEADLPTGANVIDIPFYTIGNWNRTRYNNEDGKRSEADEMTIQEVKGSYVQNKDAEITQSFSHNRRWNTTDAMGENSVTLGYKGVASATNAIAIGDHVRATASDQIALGKYNSEDTDALLIVGNGDSTATSNALKIMPNGDIYIIKDGELVKLQDLL